MISLTGKDDGGNLKTLNGGEDGVTDSRRIGLKAAFAGIFAGGAAFCFGAGELSSQDVPGIPLYPTPGNRARQQAPRDEIEPVEC